MREFFSTLLVFVVNMEGGRIGLPKPAEGDVMGFVLCRRSGVHSEGLRTTHLTLVHLELQTWRSDIRPWTPRRRRARIQRSRGRQIGPALVASTLMLLFASWNGHEYGLIQNGVASVLDRQPTCKAWFRRETRCYF